MPFSEIMRSIQGVPPPPTMQGGAADMINTALQMYMMGKQMQAKEQEAQAGRLGGVMEARRLYGPEVAGRYAQAIGAPDIMAPRGPRMPPEAPGGLGAGIGMPGAVEPRRGPLMRPEAPSFMMGAQGALPTFQRAGQVSRQAPARRAEYERGRGRPMGKIPREEAMWQRQWQAGQPMTPEQIAQAEAQKFVPPAGLTRGAYPEWFAGRKEAELRAATKALGVGMSPQEIEIEARKRADATTGLFYGKPILPPTSKREIEAMGGKQAKWQQVYQSTKDALSGKQAIPRIDPTTVGFGQEEFSRYKGLAGLTDKEGNPLGDEQVLESLRYLTEVEGYTKEQIFERLGVPPGKEEFKISLKAPKISKVQKAGVRGAKAVQEAGKKVLGGIKGLPWTPWEKKLGQWLVTPQRIGLPQGYAEGQELK